MVKLKGVVQDTKKAQDFLKSQHTKQLLKLRIGAKYNNWDYLHLEHNTIGEGEAISGYYFKDEYKHPECFVTFDDIKRELSTREHVLNKKESLAKRKARIKKGK